MIGAARAACVAEQMVAMRAQSRLVDAMQEALDRLPIGVMGVSVERHVLLANRPARRVVEANDGLTLDGDGRLDVPGDAGFRSALSEVVGREPRTFRIARPSGRPPWTLLLVSGGASRQLTTRVVQVLIFITDPVALPTPRAQVLESLYLLTPAEADLAAELMRGSTITTAARRLRITSNTARTQLRHIFAKTGVRRQAELIRVLMTGPATLDTAWSP